MNMKALFIAPITALLLGVSGAGAAATSSNDGTTAGMKVESGMMQMHGEMMRAMGDIMIKYADKLEVPSSPQ